MNTFEMILRVIGRNVKMSEMTLSEEKRIRIKQEPSLVTASCKMENGYYQSLNTP